MTSLISSTISSVYQAMIIIAWHQRVSSNALFDDGVLQSVSSIFVTAAILNFLRGNHNIPPLPQAHLHVLLMCVYVFGFSRSPFLSTRIPSFKSAVKKIHDTSTIYYAAFLDIALSFNAWRSLKYTQTLRYLLKLAVAAFWLVVMPIAYSRSVQNPSGIIRFFNALGGDWQTQSLYYYCVAIYLIPNIFSAILFLFPCIRKSMERSNWRIISILMWWSQVSF